jgi:hypothetical protein
MNNSIHENMNNIKLRNTISELSTLFTDAIEQVNIVLFNESRLALSQINKLLMYVEKCQIT